MRLFILFWVFILYSCSQNTGKKVPKTMRPKNAHVKSEEASKPQSLAAYSYKLCGTRFLLEEARSFAEQRVGMMFREGVEEKKGMVFIYDKARPQGFWMKNVSFDLDIAFFDSKGRYINHHTMKGTSPLLKESQLPTYRSDQAAQYVVEVAAGFFDSLKTKQRKECLLKKEKAKD